MFVFFKQMTAYDVRSRDWSSVVFASDLRVDAVLQRIQPAGDRGEGGADVVVAAALDDVAGRAEHTAAEAGAAAQRGDDAAELAHRGRVVVANAVGDVDQPPLQVAAIGAAGELVLIRGQVAGCHRVGFRRHRVDAGGHRDRKSVGSGTSVSERVN